jgi:hypothetical protein
MVRRSKSRRRSRSNYKNRKFGARGLGVNNNLMGLPQQNGIDMRAFPLPGAFPSENGPGTSPGGVGGSWPMGGTMPLAYWWNFGSAKKSKKRRKRRFGEPPEELTAVEAPVEEVPKVEDSKVVVSVFGKRRRSRKRSKRRSKKRSHKSKKISKKSKKSKKKSRKSRKKRSNKHNKRSCKRSIDPKK